MHPDVARLHEAVQSVDDRLTDLQAAVEAVNDPDKLRRVIVAALREAAADPVITRAVYDTMAGHARQSLAQAIGERFLAAFAVLVIAAASAWFYVTGHIR